MEGRACHRKVADVQRCVSYVIMRSDVKLYDDGVRIRWGVECSCQTFNFPPFSTLFLFSPFSFPTPSSSSMLFFHVPFFNIIFSVFRFSLFSFPSSVSLLFSFLSLLYSLPHFSFIFSADFSFLPPSFQFLLFCLSPFL